MLSIGEFSKLSKVTTNTLRYYDEIGLLKPLQVNEENGYRMYDTNQLHIIVLINRLKLYSLSLEEIAEVLKNPFDNQVLLSMLKQKQLALKEKANNLDFALNQMQNDMLNLERGKNIMSYIDTIEVKLINKEPMNVLFIREMMQMEDTSKYIGRLYERIAKDKLTAIGAPMTVFHHDGDYNMEDKFDNELAVPIKEKVEGTREVPGGLYITATLKGPYSQLVSVYAKMQEWLEKENYELSGEPYEVYASDPFRDKPENFVTEVYFPVKKK